MSGRGYSGRGRAGRGSGRSSAGGSKSTTTEHKKQVMEFTPQIAGKHQSIMFDAVKEHILQEIQTTLKNGSDLAVNLRSGIDTGIPEVKPVREIAKPDPILKYVKTEVGTDEELAAIGQTLQEAEDAELAIEQKGLDMEFGMDLKEWKIRKKIYAENMFKAYSIIWGFCNKTMQNRIEESIEFEAVIRDDPFKLLPAIKLRMYGQTRAKYEYVQPTDT